jgi:hypothetical protein
MKGTFIGPPTQRYDIFDGEHMEIYRKMRVSRYFPVNVPDPSQ